MLLFWFKFVPTGHISYIHSFKGENSFISDITPAERVAKEDGRVKLIGDPAYFTLRTPRPFTTATVTLKYKFPAQEAEIMELGILVDDLNWRYKLKPIENKIVDRLSLVWDKLEQDGIMLLQKEARFSSLKEFREQPPGIEKISLYNYDWDRNYFLDDYEPVEEGIRIRAPLQGSFQFYTYIKEETLDVQFKFWDINKNRGKDDLKIILYFQDTVIASKDISGDGISEASKEVNDLGRSGFSIPGLTEGVYKVEVYAGDDIITEEIDSGQHKLSFSGGLNLAKPDIGRIGAPEVYPLKLYTDSKQLHAKTTHPSGLQFLAVGEEEGEGLDLTETYKKFSYIPDNNSQESTAISINKPGVILNGDGVFSFSREALLNGEVSRLRSGRAVEEEMEYVLTDYKKWSRQGEWKVKETAFDLGSAYSEDGKYRFLISIPGLKEDDDIDDYVIIDEIKIELKGDSILEILKRKLK